MPSKTITVGHVTSAKHGCIDWVRVSDAGVGRVASRVRDNWDVDAQKDVGDAAAGRGGSPTRNSKHGSCSWVVQRSRQVNGLG